MAPQRRMSGKRFGGTRFWLVANFLANGILVFGLLRKLNGGEATLSLVVGAVLTGVCMLALTAAPRSE